LDTGQREIIAAKEWRISQDPTHLSFIDSRIQQLSERLYAIPLSQVPPHIAAADLRYFQQKFSQQGFRCEFRSCPFFETGFRDARERKNHESQHFPTHVCTECDFSVRGFSSKAALRKHKLKHHTDPPHNSVPEELQELQEQQPEPFNPDFEPSESFNLDFSGMETSDVLENFDFDAFLHTTESPFPNSPLAFGPEFQR
jgi:hypothetical protein